MQYNDFEQCPSDIVEPSYCISMYTAVGISEMLGDQRFPFLNGFIR